MRHKVIDVLPKVLPQSSNRNGQSKAALLGRQPEGQTDQHGESYGNVGHGRCQRGAVPVLLAARKPDYVTWPDFLDGALPTLHAPNAGRDNQRLAKRVRVPRRAGARFEGDAGTSNPRRLERLEQRLRAASFDVHAFLFRRGAALVTNIEKSKSPPVRAGRSSSKTCSGGRVVLIYGGFSALLRILRPGALGHFHAFGQVPS